MLALYFINVGDGDAVLMEHRGEDEVFRLLVDAGRGDVDARPDSRRLTAAAYLRQRGISRLDALVVTHLHADHFEGLPPLLETVEAGTVCSGFFPCPPLGRIVRTGTEEKTVRGLLDCLEQWAAITERLRAGGSRLVQADASLTLPGPAGLEIGITVPDPEAAARQRAVWAALLRGEAPDRDEVWWSAKFRNPGSLRVRLRYAGRRIELAGDCYGAAWEDGAEPCDILKVPHHGDAKALTPALVRRLRPEHAVISCSADYVARKDRPSLGAVRLLEEQGSRVWFTDSFAPPGREPAYWPSVDFIIREDGTILPPGYGKSISQ